MAPRQLPERNLLALWKALDADHSGFITAGEFGMFMKQVRPPPPPPPPATAATSAAATLRPPCPAGRAAQRGGVEGAAH